MSPHVLIVDDEPRYRQLYAQVLATAGVEVAQAESAEEAQRLIERRVPEMVVSDVRMPGASGLELLEVVRRAHPELPFLLVTAYADVRDAVAALKLGAVDYLAKPVDLDELVACVQDTLGLAATDSDDDPPAEATADLVTASPQMRALLRDAWRIAKSDATVLITGESGTGKEVLARFLHRSGSRADRPFVGVNCAALPGSLLASELFGHEKGAFTGATATRKGRFREAQGGVLFLDEVGDMPLELQPVFLRALEQRTITPVGASGEIAVDFQLVAATNRSLEEAIREGSFREDLYYRLNVIALHIAPLRERAEDILPLARRFLAREDGPSKRISRAAARALQAHAWPGNVRELTNAMQRARLLSRSEVILPDNLPPAIRPAAIPQAAIPQASGGAEALDAQGESAPLDARDESAPLDAQDDFAPLDDSAPSVSAPPSVNAPLAPLQTLQENEIATLRRALEATGGNRTKAAELLGISRRGLLNKLKRYGL